MISTNLIFIQTYKCVSFNPVSMPQLQIIKIYLFRNVYQMTHHRSLHFLVYFIELQCICHVDSSLPTMAGAGLRSLKYPVWKVFCQESHRTSSRNLSDWHILPWEKQRKPRETKNTGSLFSEIWKVDRYTQAFTFKIKTSLPLPSQTGHSLRVEPALNNSIPVQFQKKRQRGIFAKVVPVAAQIYRPSEAILTAPGQFRNESGKLYLEVRAALLPHLGMAAPPPKKKNRVDGRQLGEADDRDRCSTQPASAETKVTKPVSTTTTPAIGGHRFHAHPCYSLRDSRPKAPHRSPSSRPVSRLRNTRPKQPLQLPPETNLTSAFRSYRPTVAPARLRACVSSCHAKLPIEKDGCSTPRFSMKAERCHSSPSRLYGQSLRSAVGFWFKSAQNKGGISGGTLNLCFPTIWGACGEKRRDFL